MLADISVFAAPINTYVYHVSKKKPELEILNSLKGLGTV